MLGITPGLNPLEIGSNCNDFAKVISDKTRCLNPLEIGSNCNGNQYENVISKKLPSQSP